MNNLFRKASLDRLSSPEQLDRLITITSPKSWLLLLTIGVVLGCAIIWGVFGAIPIKVETSGILISSGGVTPVNSKVAGIVTDVQAETGDVVNAGDTIAIIGDEELTSKINKSNDTLKILKGLSLSTDWNKVSLPSELLDLQNVALEANAAAKEVPDVPSISTKELENMKEEYERYLKLFQNGVVSQADVDAQYRNYLSGLSRYNQDQATISEQKSANAKNLKKLNEEFNSLKASKVKQLQESIEEMRNQVENECKVIAPSNCKIREVNVQAGETISAGTQVASVSMLGEDVNTLEGVIYVPIAQGKKIKEGMAVKIYPTTIQKEEYGYMKGVITKVPEYPVTNEEVLKTLGNESLARDLTGNGAPLEVRINLMVDGNTASGYAWSTKKGGTVNVDSGTLCTASVVVDSQSPVSMVLPLLKKHVLPIN